MTNPLEKEILTEVDMQQLIDSQYEESINLEFKSSESLGFDNTRKLEILKDISAFSNSAGGYIVYGINEHDHKAESYSFIDGSKYTKEWLEQVIQTGIQRKIDGLIIKPVRFDKDITRSIYVVSIPESFSAPHMTSDKRFYKRYNFESVRMEEYEIRNLYNRKGRTKLTIDQIYTKKDLEFENSANGKTIYKTIYFQIQNISKSIEKDYKLLIKLIDFPDCVIQWDPLVNDKNINHSFNQNKEHTISFNGIAPIFPDELLTIGTFKIGIKENLMQSACEHGKMSLKLHFSTGYEELDTPFASLFCD